MSDNNNNSLHKYLIAGLFILTIGLFTVSSHNKQHSCFKLASQLDTNKILQFIPKGYLILDTIKGDLNGDTIEDLILILKKNGEDTMYNPSPKRPLCILIGLLDGNYKLVAKNDNVVYKHDEGGMSNDEPYDGTGIENGIFTVNHYGGSGVNKWDVQTSFKYSPKDSNWYLYKTVNHDVTLNYNNNDTINTNNPEVTVDSEEDIIKTEKDFGKILFEEYDIYKNDDE